jgi:hypothetical protein
MLFRNTRLGLRHRSGNPSRSGQSRVQLVGGARLASLTRTATVTRSGEVLPGRR